MARTVDIARALGEVRRRERTKQEELLSEAHRILEGDLFTSKKILQNLGRYEQKQEKLDEEEVDPAFIFTREDVRKIAMRQRLKFLPSRLYKPEIPYEALLKISHMNEKFRKDLKHFFILSYPLSFESPGSDSASLLFAQTNYDNFYLLHQWGKHVPWSRQWLYWPLRSFETLLVTVICFTLCVTLILPTNLITLDSKAEYWSGYRAAAFFHLLIFNSGITTYITLTFTRNFSSSVWDRKLDFD